MLIICRVILCRKKIALRVKSYVMIQLLDPTGLAWRCLLGLARKRSSWLWRFSHTCLSAGAKDKNYISLFIFFTYLFYNRVINKIYIIFINNQSTNNLKLNFLNINSCKTLSFFSNVNYFAPVRNSRKKASRCTLTSLTARFWKSHTLIRHIKINCKLYYQWYRTDGNKRELHIHTHTFPRVHI